MKRVISDIQISGGKGAQCDSVAVRPTVDSTDTPYRRVAEQEIDEILYSDSDVGDYVTDFRKSKAPQFKGKSKEKRTQMAVAAALDAKDKKKKKRGKK